MTLLRALALERLLRGLVVLSVGFEGLRLSTSRAQSLTEWDQVLGLVSQINPRVSDSVLHSSFYSWFVRLQHGSTTNWVTLFAAIFCYGLLICTEAVGLWLDLLWAEKLTVVSTSALIPVEIFELAKGISLLKVGALIVNIFLVIWLYRTKWRPNRSVKG